MHYRPLTAEEMICWSPEQWLGQRVDYPDSAGPFTVVGATGPPRHLTLLLWCGRMRGVGRVETCAPGLRIKSQI